MEPPTGEGEILRAEKARRRQAEVDADRIPRVESIVSRVAACVQAADIRLPQYAPLETCHREIFSDHRRIVVVARTDVQDPDVLGAHLAGHLRAEVNLLRRAARAQPDPPAEKRNDLVAAAAPAEVLPAAIADEIKKRRAIEEKIAALGEEEGITRQVHLALIHLDLCEIGVHGQVRANRGRRVVEKIDAGVGVPIEASPAQPRRLRRADQAIRLDVEAAPLRHVLDAGDMTGVRHPLQPLIAGPAHPDTHLVLAMKGALDIEAPRVAVRIEVERAEGKLNLERPADLTAPRPGRPDAVPGAVLAGVAHERVRHRAFRIHFEEIPGARVQERVDGPSDFVVGAQRLVAPALLPDDGIGLGVVRRHAQVQRVAVKRDTDVRSLRCGLAVVRVDLYEVARRNRARPDGLVQPAIDVDRFPVGQARGRDAAAAAIFRRRLLGGARSRVGAVFRRRQRGRCGALGPSRWGACEQHGSDYQEP